MRCIKNDTKLVIDCFAEEIISKCGDEISDESKSKLRAISKSFVEESISLKNFNRKLSHLIDKHMSIPKHVLLPADRLQELPEESRDDMERQLEEDCHKLELVYKQQAAMLAKAEAELKVYEQLEEDMKIDNSLCELVESVEGGLSLEQQIALANIVTRIDGRK